MTFLPIVIPLQFFLCMSFFAKPVSTFAGAASLSCLGESLGQRSADRSGPAILPVNAAAHDLFLRGRYAWYQREREPVRQSAELLERAVAMEPHYALAWAGLADSYALIAAWGMGRSAENLQKAEAAARRQEWPERGPRSDRSPWMKLSKRSRSLPRSALYEFGKSLEVHQIYLNVHFGLKPRFGSLS